MIFDAIEFAAKAHRNQFRKGTQIPYLIHPMRVAKILIESECPEEVIVAGLLHDTIEDTPVTMTEIRHLFGERVAELVAGVSEPDKSKSWEFRKQHTLESLDSAPIEIVVISCADKIDNIQSIRRGFEKIGENFFNRFNRPKSKQQWYYFELMRIFSRRLSKNHYAGLATAFAEEVQRTFGN